VSARPPEPRALLRQVSVRTANICLAFAVFVSGVYLLLPAGLTQSVVYDGLGFVSAAAILVGVRRNRPSYPLPWYLFSLGLVLYSVGDVIWDVYDLWLNRNPFPSVADGFYLSCYPCFFFGLLLLVRRLGRGQGWAATVDALIVTAGIAVPTWVFVIDPNAHSVGSTVLQRAILVAYPIMDLILLGVLARLLFVPGGRTASFRALVAAVVLMTFADLVYAGGSDTYNAGNWLDVPWLLSRCLWGIAALYPSMRLLTEVGSERETRLSPRHLVLLVLASALAPAVLLVERAHSESIDAIAIAIGGATLSLLVLLRMAGLLRQTERLRLDERRADQRMRDVVDDLDGVVWEATGDMRRFSFVAGRVEDLLGYPSERWLDEEDFWERLVHPEDRVRVGALRRRALERSKDYTAEYRAMQANGRTIWVRDLVHVHMAGEEPLLRGLMIDVSERRRVDAERDRLLVAARQSSVEAEQARRELAEQNERLLELDRLKDEFVALVSHELRSPLTSIRGYLELVLDGHAGDVTEDQRQFLEVVQRGADRLLHLVGDLLFVAQVQAGALSLELVDVDLRDLASQAIEAAKPAAEQKGIQLVPALNGAVTVLGDRDRLGQLVDNLLSNAVKFTSEGGEVEIVVADDGEGALFEVRDSGIGIPEAEQRRLFERFFRSSAATKRAIPGTGLGLGIAKAIVDAHGGAIEVESAEGIGTTFRVRLPLDRPRQATRPREQAVA
jgi:PAS domain S-box-containing protein